MHCEIRVYRLNDVGIDVGVGTKLNNANVAPQTWPASSRMHPKRKSKNTRRTFEK